MKDSIVVTKSGYAGDDIRRINPINPSVRTRSATEQLVYETFVVDKKELLNEEEREAVANTEKVEKKNQSIQEQYEYMNSKYNPIKEKLYGQNKSRK